MGEKVFHVVDLCLSWIGNKIILCVKRLEATTDILSNANSGEIFQ